MTRWQLILAHILRPFGRLLGTDRWEPRVTAACHCVACGHRFVYVIRETLLGAIEDDGPIDGVACRHCGRELVFWDAEVADE
jgi:hypothetical protein